MFLTFFRALIFLPLVSIPLQAGKLHIWAKEGPWQNIMDHLDTITIPSSVTPPLLFF